MKLPTELHHEIIEFFLSIPNLHSPEARRAFIYDIGIDDKLERQINFSGSSKEFFPLLISALEKYGKLENGQEAVVMALKATGNYVGLDKRQQCNALLEKIDKNFDKYTSKELQADEKVEQVQEKEGRYKQVINNQGSIRSQSNITGDNITINMN